MPHSLVFSCERHIFSFLLLPSFLPPPASSPISSSIPFAQARRLIYNCSYYYLFYLIGFFLSFLLKQTHTPKKLSYPNTTIPSEPCTRLSFFLHAHIHSSKCLVFVSYLIPSCTWQGRKWERESFECWLFDVLIQPQMRLTCSRSSAARCWREDRKGTSSHLLLPPKSSQSSNRVNHQPRLLHWPTWSHLSLLLLQRPLCQL